MCETTSASQWCPHVFCPFPVTLEQIVKKKVRTGEDGRGRFKTTSDKPLRIADREKKPALKT